MNGQKMFMIVDIDRCWGCKACQVACKREHGLASEDFKPVEVFRVENMQGDKVRCDFLPACEQHCLGGAFTSCTEAEKAALLEPYPYRWGTGCVTYVSRVRSDLGKAFEE